MVEIIKDRIIRISTENWRVLGQLLYGKDTMDWKFICPRCNRIQTAKDFLKYKDNDKVDSLLTANYHCLSRYDRVTDIKCYWTLDGVYRIHKLELKAKRDDGTYEISPSFEFADALITEEELDMIRFSKDSGFKGMLEKMLGSENESSKIWAAFVKEGFNL